MRRCNANLETSPFLTSSAKSHLRDNSFFDIATPPFCNPPSAMSHFSMLQCPPICDVSFLMSSAMPHSEKSHFLTLQCPPFNPCNISQQHCHFTLWPLPLQLCHIIAQHFPPQHHHFTSQYFPQQHLPAMSHLGMLPFYGAKSPTEMLLFHDATFPQHLQFSLCHLLPPSPLKPCPK